MQSTLKVFKAGLGDALMLSFIGDDGKKHNILIDGGMPGEYNKHLKKEIERININDENIDLAVVTHIDLDHIGGILRLFSEESDRSLIKEIWFNSKKLIAPYINMSHDAYLEVRMLDVPKESKHNLGTKEGNTLEEILGATSIRWHNTPLVSSTTLYEMYGAKITILSPNMEKLSKIDKVWPPNLSSKVRDHAESIDTLSKLDFEEDESPSNGSSIALLIEINNKKYLFLADAHPSIIVSSLKNLNYSKSNKLVVDFVKISHHSSKGNTSPELLEIIDCNNFIISTNGKNHFLPHKETLARIVTNPERNANQPIHFYFNYSHKSIIISENECETYNVICHFAKDSESYLAL
jgi:hypothetical protein